MYAVITYGKKSTLELVFEPLTLARQRFESNVLPVNKNLINTVYRKLVVYRWVVSRKIGLVKIWNVYE